MNTTKVSLTWTTLLITVGIVLIPSLALIDYQEESRLDFECERYCDDRGLKSCDRQSKTCCGVVPESSKTICEALD